MNIFDKATIFKKVVNFIAIGLTYVSIHLPINLLIEGYQDGKL